MKFLQMIMIFALIGCGDTTTNESTVKKSDVASVNGKGDSADLDKMCKDLDRDPGCDPCAVQKWYGDGSCDDFCPVKDSDCGIDDYTITAELPELLSASMLVIYQSTKDSFGCTDFNLSSLRREPEVIEKDVDSNCNNGSCAFAFPNELNDGCESVVRNIYFGSSNATGSLDPSVMEIREGGDSGVQLGKCTLRPGSILCTGGCIEAAGDTLTCSGFKYSGKGEANLKFIADEKNGVL